MEKAVGGAGTQLARLQIDWSALDVEEPPEEPPATDPPGTVETPVTQAPDASKSVAVAPVIGSGDNAAGGKTAESTVTPAQTADLTSAAADAAAAAKTAGATKIAAGETAVAEIIVAVGDTAAAKAAAVTEARTAGVTETVTQIPLAAVTALTDAADAARADSVELVLTVESALASGLAEVKLDAATLAQAAREAADTDDVLTITVTADATAALSAAQRMTVPTAKVPLAVTLRMGDTPITALPHAIAVTIPYTKSAAANTIAVYYVAADGQKEACAAAYSNGRLTFTTDKI
jgi:hypothetical protein